jgi:hypothetical protein
LLEIGCILKPHNVGRTCYAMNEKVLRWAIVNASRVNAKDSNAVDESESQMTEVPVPQVGSLSTSADYFLNVLHPNALTFFRNPSTFASALNLATSLYHFHEWLFQGYKSGLETELRKQFGGAGAFWKEVETVDSDFGYIRDVANASKHVTIGGAGRRPSTGMGHIANTHIIVTGYGEGPYGAGRYGGGPSVVFDDQGTQISFDSCATKLFDYWKHLLEKLQGHPLPGLEVEAH